MDPGETPEELLALAAVFTGFAVLLASAGTALVRGREAAEAARLQGEADRLLDAMREDPALAAGDCLSASALNATADLDRLAPSARYRASIEDVVLGLRWEFGDLVGEGRLALGAACLRQGGGLVTPARLAVAVGP